MKTKKIYIFTIAYIIALFLYTHLLYVDAFGYMNGKYFAEGDSDSALFGLLFLPVWFSAAFIISQKINSYNFELIRYGSYKKWWGSIEKKCIPLIASSYIIFGIMVGMFEKSDISVLMLRVLFLIINTLFIFELQLLIGLLCKQTLFISLITAFMEVVAGKIRMRYEVPYYMSFFTWWEIPAGRGFNKVDIIILSVEILLIIFGICAMRIRLFNNILRGREYGDY